MKAYLVLLFALACKPNVASGDPVVYPVPDPGHQGDYHPPVYVPPHNVDPCQKPAPGGAESELQSSINRVRSQHGAGELKLDLALTCAAQKGAQAIEQAHQCSHTGADGSSPWDRAKACHGTAFGEILACGYDSAASAVQGWLESPSHAQIMLDPANRTMGGAVVNGYWVVDFGH